MMETHYNNPSQDADITDTSGVRLHYTTSLRKHDAGVLSVGMDPNWRHLIPPGQPEVVSEGHCISACTQQAVPPRGIKVIAVILHTHFIGTLKTSTCISVPESLSKGTLSFGTCISVPLERDSGILYHPKLTRQ
jgi:hypothetical protein